MSLNRIYFFCITILLIITSCNRDDEELITNIDRSYYPVEEGRYAIYDCLEITYDDFFVPVKIDTTAYQLKMLIDSVESTGNNKFSFVLRRFTRDSIGKPWTLKDNWKGDKTENLVLVYEENIPFIKLIFPVRLAKTWDGNAYNTEPNQTYSYSSVQELFTLNGMTFVDAAEVIQMSRSNLIEQIFASETYAPGIGMVEKVDTSLRTTIDGQIESGYKRWFQMKEYGIE